MNEITMVEAFLQKYPGSGGWHGPGWEVRRRPWLAMAEAALPVIVAAVTDEVRKLHVPLDEKLWLLACIEGDCEHWTDDTMSCEEHCPPSMDQVCRECYGMGTHPDDGWENHFDHSIKWPCPTVRLLDEIDAAAGVTR